MYLYIVVSSIFLGALIAQSCFRKQPERDYEDLLLDFPDTHYLRKIQLLNYFCEEKNYDRLEKILDYSNGVFDKIKNLLEIDEDIKQDYLENKEFYENIFPFEIESSFNISFDLNGKEIQSSLGQLNFFRWLFENDYLLHIE